MKGVVLDSDVLIHLLKNNPEVTESVAMIAPVARYTTIINCAELLYGAYNSTAPAMSVGVTRSLLSSIQVLPLDAKACDIYGRTKAQLRKQGITLGDKDLFIASMAMAHGMPVYTRNIRDFMRIPDLTLHQVMH